MCTPDWGCSGEHAYWRRMLVKRYPEPHGQVTAYNRSPVH